MHHDGTFCPWSRLRRQPAPWSEHLAIMFWDHCPHYHQRSGERQEERTKTPYSLDINLITTRLSIAANRCAVNRFPRSLSEYPLNSSWCAAPRRWLVLTYQLGLMEIGQLLVFKKNGFWWTCNVSRTPWRTCARTFNQDHHGLLWTLDCRRTTVIVVISARLLQAFLKVNLFRRPFLRKKTENREIGAEWGLGVWAPKAWWRITQHKHQTLTNDC